MVGVASASDGAGSIRIPAACCGLYGFKPSPGRTVGSGGWEGLSVQGSLARSVGDSVWYVDAVASPGCEPLTPNVGRDPGRLRIGVSTTPMRAAGTRGEVDDEILAAVRDAAETLAGLGHEVHEVAVPQERAANEFALRYMHAVRESVWQVEDPRRLERRTRQVLRIGATVPGRAARAARRSGEQGGGRLDAALADVDLLLTPVTNRLPVEVGRWARTGGLRTVLGMARVYGFTGLWNHTGRPAASVPAGLSRDRLPLAVQLVGRRGGDADVVAVSAQLEQTRPWAGLRPPLAAGAHG
jgi:amidase